MPASSFARPPRRNRGAISVLAAILLAGLAGCLALAIDVGHLCVARVQLQRSADASAMAAAWELLREERLTGDPAVLQAFANGAAAQYAARNPVLGKGPILEANQANDFQGDIVVGRYIPRRGFTAGVTGADNNAVQVRVRRTTDRNGEVPLFFAPMMGVTSSGMSATALAAFRDGIVGFRPRKDTGNSSLIPLTVRIDDWMQILEGQGEDAWSYHVEDGSIESGGDGLPELSLFLGNDKIAPGNFGTLNFGRSNMGTGRLGRQIRKGLSAHDLRTYGGELRLSRDEGTVNVRGDVGLETPVRRAAQDILGKPVSLPLFRAISGQGATATYAIVGFAGARIVHVQLTGKNARIVIQPAIVVDDSALSDSGKSSYHVYQPVVLVD